MIRLAIAVGFLSVFGFVAYVIVVLLTNHFKSKEENNSKTKVKPKKEKQNASK